MEVLLFIVLLVSLATITASLVCTLVVLYFITQPLFKKKTVSPRVRRYKRVMEEAPDAVKPDDAFDETTPIESFEPDFTKPIKVTISKEAKKSHTVDDEELTPIETDDLAEEDEEELIKKGLK